MDNPNRIGLEPIKGSLVLLLDKVSFSWSSSTTPLDLCSFEIPKPGLWMIVGRNGSGKSTLFRLIAGLLAPQSGKLVCSLKPALMFQNPDHQLLLPTCGSDLLLGLPKNLTRIEREEIVEKCLNQVGLVGMQSRPINTLSGGQKQRLALAGALASEAKLLLLDEPTALLDPISQRNVLSIVQGLCRNKKDPITALWVTHRLEELDYCDGAALMENGQIGEWFSGNQLKKRVETLATR